MTRPQKKIKKPKFTRGADTPNLLKSLRINYSIDNADKRENVPEIKVQALIGNKRKISPVKVDSPAILANKTR